jgi:hypothetical protein
MKYIIILLAINNIVIGEICGGLEFKNVFDNVSFFAGNFYYNAPLNEKVDIGTFKIEEIKEGQISDWRSGLLYASSFWSPKLDCQPPKSGTKVCLLQYISIRENQLMTIRTELTFSVEDKKFDDCINEMRQLLLKNQPTSTKISNIEADYQRFSFVVPMPGHDRILNFNTKTMKFSWEDENIEIDGFTIRKNGQLTKGEIIYLYKKDPQSISLMKKVRKLLEKCPSRDGMYNYYDLRLFDSTGMKSLNGGKVDLNSLDDIKLPIDKKFSLVTYKPAKSKFPVYEKYNLKFTLEDEDNAEYTFYVHIPNIKCFAHIEGCPLQAEKTLFYFKEVDLQRNKEHNFEGVIRGLEFIPEERAVKEREGNNTKLKLTLSKFYLYDFELRQDLNKEDWLFIKGIDADGEIINKKYLVKTTNSKRCTTRYKNLKTELYAKLEKQGKYFLWEIENKNDEDKPETFKPLGVMDVYSGQITKQGEIDPINFDKLNFTENILTVMLGDDVLTQFDKLSKKCLKRLELLFPKLTGVFVVEKQEISLKPTSSSKTTSEKKGRISKLWKKKQGSENTSDKKEKNSGEKEKKKIQPGSQNISEKKQKEKNSGEKEKQEKQSGTNITSEKKEKKKYVEDNKGGKVGYSEKRTK